MSKSFQRSTYPARYVIFGKFSAFYSAGEFHKFVKERSSIIINKKYKLAVAALLIPLREDTNIPVAVISLTENLAVLEDYCPIMPFTYFDRN